MSLFELGLRNTALAVEALSGLAPLAANETPEGYNARIAYVAANATEGGGASPEANDLTLPAGGTVSGHRAVYLTNGKWFTADADSVVPGVALAMSTHAAVLNDALTARFHGLITMGGWSWSPGPVWLGAAGALTQTPPTSGTLIQMGSAASPTSVFINPTTPVVYGEA